MKAIFIGNESMEKVYAQETRARLLETGVSFMRVTRAEIIENAERFRDAEFLFSTWGMECFTEAEIRRYLPSLRAVFYAAGSVQYFARPFLMAGVRVFSAWAANAVPVIEYTVSQVLLANKGFFLAARRSRSLEGRGDARGYFDGMPGNYGATVGVIGAGMIGRGVIERLRGYRLTLLVYDPFLSDAEAEALGVTRVSLAELFSRSQTITNHVANLPSTVGMLRYEHFSLMKPNATFINTGRGAQVVEGDLIRALCEEPCRTAILDVTDPEPPLADSPIYRMENVFLTPHIAGSSGDEVARMGEYMAEEYERFLSGGNMRYEVTLPMLERMA